MTNEKLAKHWHVSLEEVQNISDFMNKTYYLCVGQSKKTGLWHGMMYEIDRMGRHRLAFLHPKGSTTEREAAKSMNRYCNTMRMPDGRASIHDVPQDAYKSLKRLQTAPIAHYKQQNISFSQSQGHDVRD